MKGQSTNGDANLWLLQQLIPSRHSELSLLGSSLSTPTSDNCFIVRGSQPTVDLRYRESTTEIVCWAKF